jgi:hypothetical protein
MKQIFLILIMAAALDAAQPFAGRWDLTVTTPKDTYPSWMEVTQSGGQPQVRVVGRVASVHPATDVKLEGAHLSFTTSEWFDSQIKVTWDLHAAAGKLTGVEKRADGLEGQIAGVPAPSMRRKLPAAWTKPESLFDGLDLNGWEPDDPAHNNWVAQQGELVNQAAGANIRTTRKFGDFKLHIEYNCPADGNSGVYLRGRYEVQVEYEKAGENDQFHAMGSIYGFLAPAVEIAKRPGQWETYDVTLVGRTVTVVRDGQTTIDHKEIPGITGGAIDSREGEPGPIYIQGDHTGGMKYRNITISVPER